MACTGVRAPQLRAGFRKRRSRFAGPGLPTGPFPMRIEGLRLHMPPQKGGDGLGQLVFRVPGGDARRRADEQHHAQQIPLGEDGGGHVGDQLVAAVADGDGVSPAVILVDAAAFHDLLQLGGDALAQQLPLAASGHGDDRVPVRHGADAAGGAAHGLAELPGEILHAAQQGILLKNHLAVPAGVNLQGIALPDTHGAANFLGDDHPAKVVNPAHNSSCLHIKKLL